MEMDGWGVVEDGNYSLQNNSVEKLNCLPPSLKWT